MNSLTREKKQPVISIHIPDPVAELVEWFRLSTLKGKNLLLYTDLLAFIESQRKVQKPTQANLPNLDNGDKKTETFTLHISKLLANPSTQEENNNPLLIRVLNWLNNRQDTHDESFFTIMATFITNFPAYSSYISEKIYKQLPHWTKRFDIAEQYHALTGSLTPSQKLRSLYILDAKDHQSCLDAAISEMVDLKDTFLLRRFQNGLDHEEIQTTWHEMSVSDRNIVYDKLLSLPSFRTGNDKNAINVFEKLTIKSSKFTRFLAHLKNDSTINERIREETFIRNTSLVYMWKIIYPYLTPAQKTGLSTLLRGFLKTVFSENIPDHSICESITTVRETSFMLVNFQDENILFSLLDLLKKTIEKFTEIEAWKALLAYFLLEKIKISLPSHDSLSKKYDEIFLNLELLSTHFSNALKYLTDHSDSGTRTLASNVFSLFFKNIHARLMMSDMKKEADVTFFESLLETHFHRFTEYVAIEDGERKGSRKNRRLAVCETSAAILPYLVKFPKYRKMLLDSLAENLLDETICDPQTVCKALSVAHRYPPETQVSENKSLDTLDSFTLCNFTDLDKKMEMRATQYTFLITDSSSAQPSKSAASIREEMIAYCTDQKGDGAPKKMDAQILTTIFQSLAKGDPARPVIAATLLESLQKLPVSDNRTSTICQRINELHPHLGDSGKQDEFAKILSGCLLTDNSYNISYTYSRACRLLGDLFPYIGNKASTEQQLPDIIKTLTGTIKTLSNAIKTHNMVNDAKTIIMQENLKAVGETLATAATSLTQRQKNILISDLVTILKKNPCTEVLFCVGELIMPSLQEEALNYHLPPVITSIVTSYLTPARRR